MVYRGLYSYRQRVRFITLFPNIFFVFFLLIKVAPYSFFVRARADFENLAMAQAFKLYNFRQFWHFLTRNYFLNYQLNLLLPSVTHHQRLFSLFISNSTPKSRARSRSKMRTNMASKLLKFVYRKCCVDRLLFQNIFRLNRRPYLSLLDLFKREMYEVCRSFNQWSWFLWFVRSPR